MAKVRIVDIVEHLDHEMKRALASAVQKQHPEITVDRTALFKEFLKALRREFTDWQTVPHNYVDGE